MVLEIFVAAVGFLFLLAAIVSHGDEISARSGKRLLPLVLIFLLTSCSGRAQKRDIRISKSYMAIAQTDDHLVMCEFSDSVCRFSWFDTTDGEKKLKQKSTIVDSMPSVFLDSAGMLVVKYDTRNGLYFIVFDEEKQEVDYVYFNNGYSDETYPCIYTIEPKRSPHISAPPEMHVR